MVYFFKLYSIDSLDQKTEYCFYIQSNLNKEDITSNTWSVLYNLISHNQLKLFCASSFLECQYPNSEVIEFGPNLTVSSPWASNALSILRKSNVNCIERIERSYRTIDKEYFHKTFDKMTQVKYQKQLVSFEPIDNNLITTKSSLYEHPFLIDTKNIREYSQIYGLGLSDSDVSYYKRLFDQKLNRKINNVELVMLAQMNSEHSRHRFFKGKFDVYQFKISKLEQDKLLDHKYTRSVCAQYIKKEDNQSLMDKIKTPYICNINNSVIAFEDNASAIKGFELMQLNQYWNPILENTRFQPDSDDEISNFTFKTSIYLQNRRIVPMKRLYHPTLKGESHNFPTGVAPFEGAATGVGGRIRDTIAVGRGGFMAAGLAGYSVGNLIPKTNSPLPDEIDNSPMTILIKASDGASDYGNKIGEPIIGGYTRVFGDKLRYREIVPENKPSTSGFGRFMVKNVKEYREYLKPIMFSAGIGFVCDDHIEKSSRIGLSVIRVGGPAYRVGLGGGTASSRDQDTKNKELDLAAVQRGDPEMESKVVKFVLACLHMGINNPIVSIHDQGAGGMANVSMEIAEPHGAIIYIHEVEKGDKSMSDMEVWLSEYQEQVTMLVNPNDVSLLTMLAERENVSLTEVGRLIEGDEVKVLSVVDTDGTNKYEPLYLSDDDEEYQQERIIKMVDMPSDILDDIPRNKYNLIEPYYSWTRNERWHHVIGYKQFSKVVAKVLQNPNVGSKRFLTSKVDRSVGQVAQQQTVGITQAPLSDYSMVACNYFGSIDMTPNGKLTFPGVVSAIGERPIPGIYDINKMVRLTVAEMLTNMIWAGIEDFSMIRCSANWMWANATENDKFLLYSAVKTLDKTLDTLGIAIDGGKDSLSMSVKTKSGTIKSPNTLVLTGYVTTMDVSQKVNPGFVKTGNHIIYINLSHKNNRLGASIMSQEYDTMSDVGPVDVPDFMTLEKFPELFDYIQTHIKMGNIISGHDVSDGGLITTLLEMCFPNNKGFHSIFEGLGNNNCYETYLSEEPGLVMEFKKCNSTDEDYKHFIADIKKIGYHQTYYLGRVTDGNVCIMYKNKVIMNVHQFKARHIWEEPAQTIEKIQIGSELAQMELDEICSYPIKTDLYQVNQNLLDRLNTLEIDVKLFENVLNRRKDIKFIPKVAILREEGSNGDREMKAAFMLAGFETFDIHMNDLILGKIKLNDFLGVVFVGGFSYSDVFGAGEGWASCIRNHPEIAKQFKIFYDRDDTFSLGVCNGCQLMSSLEWVPFKSRFVENNSKRFESRYTLVEIQKNNSIMLQNLQGMSFGVWSAHGEGKYQSDLVSEAIQNNDFVDNPQFDNAFPLKYIDNFGNPTEIYPHNPNGSPQGICAITSKNGRHLAMMPHPERSFLMWQLAYCPPELKEKLGNLSPWFLMFRNAYTWCQANMDAKLAKEQQELDDIDLVESSFM